MFRVASGRGGMPATNVSTDTPSSRASAPLQKLICGEPHAPLIAREASNRPLLQAFWCQTLAKQPLQRELPVRMTHHQRQLTVKRQRTEFDDPDMGRAFQP